jgi:DNA modification methylase
MLTLLGKNDAMAYLVNMAPRLVALHRVLKPTGSLYLHCDPTMSHYLKVMLDAIFGPTGFRSEIIWKRTGAHSSAKRYGPVHDTILFYSRSDVHTWNPVYVPHDPEYVASHYTQTDPDGRQWMADNLTAMGTRQGSSGQAWRGFDVAAKGNHWKFTIANLEKLDEEGRLYWPKNGGWPRYKRYLDEVKGTLLQDVWTDIAPMNAMAKERLGYPTQKPLALLERIIAASSNEGDLVLDPFCGCGTTVDAATRLKRRWIGIDITYLAVDLIEKRLEHTFGASVLDSYAVYGIPRDLQGAQALFRRSPLDFERWAVSLVNGTPNDIQTGDKGVDGVVRFFTDAKNATGRALVSVKGGKTVNPAMVREIGGTVQTQGAEMGLLITIEPPTRGMKDEADHAGTYTWPVNGETFPRIQLVTIEDLLAEKRPSMPVSLTPYIKAQRAAPRQDQLPLG